MATKKKLVYGDHRAVREHAKKHIHPKLGRTLRLSLLIAAVMFAVALYDAIRDGANPLWVAGGLVIGLAIGLILSRSHKISWSENDRQVTYALDALGIVLLLASVAVDVERERLVGLFTHGQSAAAMSMALLAGIMYGRFMGGAKAIGRTLREQKIIPDRPKRR